MAKVGKREQKQRSRAELLAEFEALSDDALVPVRTFASVVDVSERTALRVLAQDNAPKPRKVSCLTRLRVGDIRAFVKGL